LISLGVSRTPWLPAPRAPPTRPHEPWTCSLARIFKEGVDGFKGGLSAENYITITGASRATATRDLQDLVVKGALARAGELRHTRYFLKPDEGAA
jgi:Fic family protein